MSEKQRQARENLEWYTTQRMLAKNALGIASHRVRECEKRVKELDEMIDYWRKALWGGASDLDVVPEESAR